MTDDELRALAASIDKLTETIESLDANVSGLADSVNDLTVVLGLFDDEPPPPGVLAPVIPIRGPRR